MATVGHKRHSAGLRARLDDGLGPAGAGGRHTGDGGRREGRVWRRVAGGDEKVQPPCARDHRMRCVHVHGCGRNLHVRVHMCIRTLLGNLPLDPPPPGSRSEARKAAD